MKVKIFTEGGSDIGLGHISRCASLYDELEKRSVEVEFIIAADEKVAEFLNGRKYYIRDWLSIEILSKIDFSNSYCIIDSYLAEENVYQHIADNAIRVLYIDDLNRLNYPKGIVVNPSIYTDEHFYSENKEIKYLLGKEYVILRNAFQQKAVKEIKNEVEQILITLGGLDIRNLAPKILAGLQTEYPQITKNIVLTQGDINIKKISEMQDTKTNVYVNLDDNEMRNLMIESDIAISAAGQTVYELINVGIPFIPIQVIQNQNYTTQGLIKYNIADKILYWDKDRFLEETFFEIKRTIPVGTRRLINKRYENIIDALGVRRIISELLKDVKT